MAGLVTEPTADWLSVVPRLNSIQRKRVCLTAAARAQTEVGTEVEEDEEEERRRKGVVQVWWAGPPDWLNRWSGGGSLRHQRLRCSRKFRFSEK